MVWSVNLRPAGRKFPSLGDYRSVHDFGTCCLWWPHGVSQEYRRVDARSSPRPDEVWGEKNVPMVSHHGYVRARRTRPGWSSGASWAAASTGVERELKSTAGVCPRGWRQSGGWSSLACPRGGISRAPRRGVQQRLTLCVGRCMLNSHAGLSGHVGLSLLSTLVLVEKKKHYCRNVFFQSFLGRKSLISRCSFVL